MRSNQNKVHEISLLTRIPPFCRGANSPGRKIYYKLGKLDLLTNWDCDQVLPNFDYFVIGQMTELGNTE